jgi:hypothetical protein
MEKKFRKTYEKMEGFSFVTPVTGLNRPNTGKEDDDDDDDFTNTFLEFLRVENKHNKTSLQMLQCHRQVDNRLIS